MVNKLRACYFFYCAPVLNAAFNNEVQRISISKKDYFKNHRPLVHNNVIYVIVTKNSILDVLHFSSTNYYVTLINKYSHTCLTPNCPHLTI